MAGSARMNRRTFAKAVTAAALAPAVLAGGRADRGNGAGPGWSGDGSADAAPARQQEPSASARALADVLRERFGNRFSVEQYAAFTRDIEGALRRAATLRQQRLANGDEPAFGFAPYRSDR
ncbi:MAG: hypothetical protein HY705_07095 [Gemmatimonadetes bacterium]|nr:hypothetical protein [Gemmatimonadota bacterium]